ncbi:radical SAM protein [Vallitalea guaymasensis]|uniref:radical SAM protein n=1 Tax=Vallitalea guaymasensis TaxID=1185412 RepID=UPI000DE489A0|nr:radical SAM protein [Vallitalea guaymasensis]
MTYILYGDKKMCNDFKYIFKFIKVNEIINEEDVTIFTLIEDIKSRGISNYHIILCTKNIFDSALKDQLITYSTAESYFKLLDSGYYSELDEKIIGVWGTGGTCDNFLNTCKDEGDKINIDFYLDSNQCKWGKMYNGIEIINPEKIFELHKKVFIIVAVMAYDEIRNKLIKMGLNENIDFILYTYWNMKPSQMFKKTYYAKSINGPECSRPFDFSQIMWNGHYCCCPEWVKVPIGNPYTDTPDEAWNSMIAKIFRLSILNNTYSFCNLDKCPKPREKIMKTNNLHKAQIPIELSIAIDDSCNLRCDSCRTKLRMLNSWEKNERRAIVTKIIGSGWMQKTNMLTIGGNGEVFASDLYQELLFHPIQKERDSIYILTNGNLLTKDKIDKLKEIYNHITVSISIDAATEETYKKVRRGGNWKKLNENLKILSIEKEKKRIDIVEINMVVQKQNYKEMISFINLAKYYKFDKVFFSRILNWGTYSDEEYNRISMVDKNGKVNDELKKVLTNSIFKEKSVDASDIIKLI